MLDCHQAIMTPIPHMGGAALTHIPQKYKWRHLVNRGERERTLLLKNYYSMNNNFIFTAAITSNSHHRKQNVGKYHFSQTKQFSYIKK